MAESILEQEVSSEDKDLLVAKLKDNEVYFEATSDNRTPLPKNSDDNNSDKVKEKK